MDIPQIIPLSPSALCKVLLCFVDSPDLDEGEIPFEVAHLITEELSDLGIFCEPKCAKYYKSTRILKEQTGLEVYLILNEAVLYVQDLEKPVPSGSLLLLQNPVKVLPMEDTHIRLISVNVSTELDTKDSPLSHEIVALNLPEKYLQLALDIKETNILRSCDDTPLSEAFNKIIADAYDLEELYVQVMNMEDFEKEMNGDATMYIIQLLFGIVCGLEKTTLAATTFLRNLGYDDYIAAMKIIVTMKVDLTPIRSVIGTDTFACVSVLSYLYECHRKQQVEVEESKLSIEVVEELTVLAEKYCQKEALEWLSSL